MTLDPIQLRVLGALMEKEIATPEGYPLSLNALVNACNQRSSRDPVMELTEEQVRQALHQLEDHGLTAVARDSRVPKYEHRARTVLNMRRDETAVMCLLLLRGPQTPGELRARADRLYDFDGLDSLLGTLERLASRPVAGDESAVAPTTGPLVTILPRQPGSREARYAHLLGTPGDYPEQKFVAPTSRQRAAPEGGSGPATEERLNDLEGEVNALRVEIKSLIGRLLALEEFIEQKDEG